MATGVIRKIHPIKQSRNGGSYTRIDLILSTGEWAKTDIVKGYRNETYWKDILKDPVASIGKTLSGLRLRSDGEVNADSRFKVIETKAESVSVDNVTLASTNFNMKTKTETPRELEQCPMCLSINKGSTWTPTIMSFPTAKKTLCKTCEDEIKASTGKKPEVINIQCPSCNKRATVINGVLHSVTRVGRTIKSDSQVTCHQCKQQSLIN